MPCLQTSPRSESGVFWGEIVPGEHRSQIDSHERVLLDALTGFIPGEITAGDGA